MELVRAYALALAKLEGVDAQVVELAALLHDIGKSEGREGHHLRSHELAQRFLASTDLPKATQALILECVLRHRSASAAEEERLEVRVLQCADVLGTLFDEEWQAYSRATMPPETLRGLHAKALGKITLESARRLAEPQIARLEALIS